MIDQKLYNKITQNITAITNNNKDLTDDLIQHCILAFLELSEDKKQQMANDNKIEHFITKCAKLQFSSKTSPFYYKYRKKQQQQTELVYATDETEDILESIYRKEKCDCIDKTVSTFNFYDKALFDMYYGEGKTYDYIHNYYGISKNHLVKHIHKLTKKIKNNCKNY